MYAQEMGNSQDEMIHSSSNVFGKLRVFHWGYPELHRDHVTGQSEPSTQPITEPRFVPPITCPLTLDGFVKENWRKICSHLLYYSGVN